MEASLLNHFKKAKIDEKCFVIKKEDLSSGNLKEKEIVQEAYNHLNNFNSFLILVKSNDHKFGFFIPTKFKETIRYKYTDK